MSVEYIDLMGFMDECSSHRRMISSSYTNLDTLFTSNGFLSSVFYLLKLLEEYKKQNDIRSAFMKMEELQMRNMIFLLLQKQKKPNIECMNENKIH